MRALITGASSGIGKAFLPLFARDGHELILVARRTAPMEEAAKSLGVKCEVIGADLAAPGAAQKLFDRVKDVDLVVNNAGVGRYGKFHEADLGECQRLVQLNVTALMEMTRLFVAPMVQRGRGKILNVASTGAFQPGPGQALYYATKAFVLSLSEAMSAELAGTGVTVTALCPGPTKTEFTQTARYKETALFNATSQTAEAVAEEGYRAFMRGDRICVTGLSNKAMAVASQVAPRGLVLKIADKVLKSRGD